MYNTIYKESVISADFREDTSEGLKKLTDIKPISLLFILAHNHRFVQIIPWRKWVWAFQPFAAEARQLAAVTQFHHVSSQWKACLVELMFTVCWLIFTMLLCKTLLSYSFIQLRSSRFHCGPAVLQVLSCIFVCLSHVLLWSLLL